METVYLVDRRRYIDRRELENSMRLGVDDETDSERRDYFDRRQSTPSNLVIVADEEELLKAIGQIDPDLPCEMFASFDEQNRVYKVLVKYKASHSRNNTLH